MRGQLLRLWASRLGVAAQETGTAATAGVLQQACTRQFHQAGDVATRLRGAESLARAAVPAWGRLISTSSAPSAQALTASPVEGDAGALITQLDAIISSEGCTAKELADAAVSLAYLQANGHRRIWGKLFEKATALKGSFDAASLSSFLWGASTANVAHFKTLYDLSGPAAGLVKAFSPAQLAMVIEALGRAGVDDAELFAALGAQVQASMKSMSPADMCRVLWGVAASGVPDMALAKAVATAIAGQADGLSTTQLAQVAWAMAKAGIADKPIVDAVTKALKAKLPAVEAPQEAAAIALSAASLGLSDPELASKIAGAVKASAAGLSTTQMIHAAWGLAFVGSADKDAFAALFKGISAGLDAGLESVHVSTVAMLHEAALAVKDAKLSDKAAAYAAKVHALSAAHAKLSMPKAVAAFKADLAEHVARSMGARYRPEVEKMKQEFGKSLPNGLSVDIGVEVDKDTRLAIEAATPADLTSSGGAKGAMVARKRLLEGAGYKVLPVPHAEWAALPGSKEKCAWLLNAVKAAVPAMASRVATLQKKLEEPFDPYAE